MGVKRGTSLRNIEGVDDSVLQYLRSAYNITTLEEVVKTYSELTEKEKNVADVLRSVYERACEILSPEKVHVLENFHNKYNAGALKPQETE